MPGSIVQGFQQTINKGIQVVAVSERSAEALREVSCQRPIVVRNSLLADPMLRLQRAPGHDRMMTPVLDDNCRLYVTKGSNYLLEQ